MNAGILIAVLIYEVAIILGIGLWLAKRNASHTRKEGDFALAGRDLPVPVVAITLALTVLGTAHILGIFELAWTLGAVAIWFSIAHVILLVMVCLSTGLWVRRLGADDLTRDPRTPLRTGYAASRFLHNGGRGLRYPHA